MLFSDGCAKLVLRSEFYIQFWSRRNKSSYFVYQLWIQNLNIEFWIRFTCSDFISKLDYCEFRATNLSPSSEFKDWISISEFSYQYKIKLWIELVRIESSAAALHCWIQLWIQFECRILLAKIASGRQVHLPWKHIIKSRAHWWWIQCQDCQSKCSIWPTTW